jgi:hypothetical protein
VGPITGPVVRPGRIGQSAPEGRTIIGQEDPSTGEFSWYAFDPYGELEAVAGGDDEIWTELAGEEDEPST